MASFIPFYFSEVIEIKNDKISKNWLYCAESAVFFENLNIKITWPFDHLIMTNHTIFFIYFLPICILYLSKSKIISSFVPYQTCVDNLKIIRYNVVIRHFWRLKNWIVNKDSKNMTHALCQLSIKIFLIVCLHVPKVHLNPKSIIVRAHNLQT